MLETERPERLTDEQARGLLAEAGQELRLGLRAAVVVLVGIALLWALFRGGALRSTGGILFASLLAIVLLMVAENAARSLWDALLLRGDALRRGVAWVEGPVKRMRRFDARARYYCVVEGRQLTVSRETYDKLQDGQISTVVYVRLSRRAVNVGPGSEA